MTTNLLDIYHEYSRTKLSIFDQHAALALNISHRLQTFSDGVVSLACTLTLSTVFIIHANTTIIVTVYLYGLLHIGLRK